MAAAATIDPITTPATAPLDNPDVDGGAVPEGDIEVEAIVDVVIVLVGVGN